MHSRKAAIRAVVFDVGETLIDESRLWRAWADWLGVPRHALDAALRETIVHGQPPIRALEACRPGFDLEVEEARRRDAAQPNGFDVDDLYPDVRPCLAALRSAGFTVGIAGNQPVRAAAALRAMDLPVDFVGVSETWGIEKPAPEFFHRVADAAGVPTQMVAYVGDRLDHDVLPAVACGMTAVFMCRGPWGRVHAARPESSQAALRIRSLDGLASKLDDLKSNDLVLPP